MQEIPGDHLAWISEADMIEIDRIMIDELHIELLQMMENAGRNLARLVLDRNDPDRVLVAAGSGGNGGGGLVAARHLANAGVDVAVITTRPPDELSPAAAHQLDILTRIGVRQIQQVEAGADVIVDAVIGYSLKGAPRGASADLIDRINEVSQAEGSATAVIALDNPSGLDVTSGESPGSVVKADATMTLCLPKRALRTASVVGDLYLADISVPPSVTARFGQGAGMRPPDFRGGTVLAVAR